MTSEARLERIALKAQKAQDILRKLAAHSINDTYHLLDEIKFLAIGSDEFLADNPERTGAEIKAVENAQT